MKETTEDLSGMTANERLYVTDQLEEFNVAVANKDFKRIDTILESVEIDRTTIGSILENVKIYGVRYKPTEMLDNS